MVAIFMVPMAFFLLFYQSETRVAKLPILGPVKSLQNHDSVYFGLEKLHLQSQDGRVIIWDSLRNGIAVVSLFDTRCRKNCPGMHGSLRSLYEKYLPRPAVRFLSITTDPKYDQAEVVRKFAHHFQVDSTRWMFLTGDSTDLFNSYHALSFDSFPNNPSYFFHRHLMYLLDWKGRIRGIYDANVIRQVQSLDDQIRVLLYEFAKAKTS